MAFIEYYCVSRFDCKKVTCSMCFHAKQTKSAQEVHQRFSTRGPVDSGRYNGFSHPKMTVITAKEPTTTALFYWGLIPAWAKAPSIRKQTLNARLETLHQKPSFKSAKRCLVITDGFYEWQWLDSQGRKKQKHLITFPDDSLFSFAGLCDEWVDQSTGEIISTLSIVTTEARGIMRSLHNSKLRMPLTLPQKPKRMASWAYPRTFLPIQCYCCLTLAKKRKRQV